MLATRLITDWEELSKVEPNDSYHLKIDLESCNGWIVENSTGEGVYYLSTHTFYGRTGTPHILKQYGWDIELDNWDK